MKRLLPENVQREVERLDLSDDDLQYLALGFVMTDPKFAGWLTRMTEAHKMKLLRGDDE